MQYEDGRGVYFTAANSSSINQFESALHSLPGTYGDPEDAAKTACRLIG